MSYQHIVIAVDLNGDNRQLLARGAALADACDAKLSLIHVDIHHAPYYSALGLQTYHYSGEVPAEVTASKQLAAIAQQSSYPIPDSIVVSGELLPELRKEIDARGIDLIIFGHHHDVWSNLFSTTRQAINHLDVDVLVVPLVTNQEAL
ncbi:universal stress protein [Serratia rhizosphaerae]|uniref:Universal stress protein n=1 Tax=Serratia rhizosphaerae TaxID=2597702 RepID=A0ABX6GRM8_9GAMM|nr:MULTISPECIES: universal stress protein [Serratia]MBU3895145.1 universal stress protein [Serratia rubidaea]AVJ18258.1 universal stress protein UspA [Serratia sp. MYb239]QHA88928.1 universal stress protein UspA [Serratia rhizosphaerae]QNK34205.1 universal stress protein [Serratia sp. JUb9]QPT11893.1 universal stress protein [Serratia rubidaea]